MHYNWDKMTDTQKIRAIDKELSFETHMGVTKDDLMNMIRYMRGQFEVIDAQPTIPERTAHRIKNAPAGRKRCYYDTCSDCGYEIDRISYKHCPNCGAKFKEANHANAD